MMVDCRHVRSELFSGAKLSKRAAGHVQTCEPCAALAEEQGALAHALGLDDDWDHEIDSKELFESTLELVEKEKSPPGWFRARPAWLQVTTLFVLTLVIGMSMLIARPRGDLDAYPLPRMVLTVVIIVALILTSLLLSLRPLQHPSLPGWIWTAVTSAIVIVVFAISALPAPNPNDPLTLAGAKSFAMAFGCFKFGLLVGLPVYVLGRLFDRKGRRGTALLSASAAGLTANLALQLHCACNAPEHLILGHFTTIAGFVFFVTMLLLFERAKAH